MIPMMIAITPDVVFAHTPRIKVIHPDTPVKASAARTSFVSGLIFRKVRKGMSNLQPVVHFLFPAWSCPA